jgi:uncharacterized lipoprotein YddW (UPF0748 family)
LVVALFVVLFVNLWQPAFASSPLAVLKSAATEHAYSDQHLGQFEEDYGAFKRTLETANVRYDLLSDADLKAGQAKLASYKIIVIPMLLDLPPEAVEALKAYVAASGKVLITDGGGTPTGNAQAVIGLTGVQVTGHSTMQESKQLNWQRQPLPLQQDFAVGTLYAATTPTPGAQAAMWTDAGGQEIGTAIGRMNGNTFLSWLPGLQGEITTNAQILTYAMEDAVPGVTQQAAVQISFADYQNIQSELEYLIKRTDEAMKTAKQADLAVPFKTIQQNYESALAHVKSFHDYYKERRFYQADEEIAAARQDFSLAFAQSMPVRPVEARSVWLDRGTIVACRSESGMAALFDRLKGAGINTVYFETNNAGFCTYPTKVSTPNPEIVGWDPLGTAVKEAHRRSMELHAWIWTFAVGNLRHNPIIGKEADYPGPVLSTNDFSWALARSNGELLPNRQPEFWIDPANPEGREFIRRLGIEIVSNYNIDGFQFDYIRYPFNGKGTEMGFDWTGRMRFERETGMSLDNLDETTREVWRAWKVQQVNSFVQDTSMALRKIKPSLRISAAVYATPRRLRSGNIQQEWETWVAQGWVDTLNPMSYVATARELATMAGSVRESAEDKALVFPGLSIRQLDTAGLIEQLDTSRSIGTLGTTMFAVAQLDDKKMKVLKLGPYRRSTLLTPQADPVKASRLLMDDFAALVNRYLQDPNKHILSDQASTNDVLSQIETVQRELHGLSSSATADELTGVNTHVKTLESTIKEWLRIEAFVQRGFRAQYIASYLAQVKAILSYAAHKARTQHQQVAGQHPQVAGQPVENPASQ